MKTIEAIDLWCEWMEHGENKSPHTIRNYRSQVNKFVPHLPNVEDFTIDRVRGILAMRDTTAATTAICVSSVRNFAKFCERQGWSDGGNLHRLMAPTPPKHLPEVFEGREAEKLMETVRADAMPTTRQARDWAILELLYAQGLRVEEVCRLNLQDLSIDNLTLRVHGKGDRQRVLPIGVNQLLPLVVWASVRRPSHPEETALFVGEHGSRLDPREIRRAMDRATTKAGVRALSPHALRHSCATHMMEGGADIRVVGEMLGHTSLDTTQRYLHVATSRLMGLYASAHPRERPAA